MVLPVCVVLHKIITVHINWTCKAYTGILFLVWSISQESFVSSSLTKDDILDPLSPQDVSSTKTRNLVGDSRGKIGVDSSRKPPKPKRSVVYLWGRRVSSGV